MYGWMRFYFDLIGDMEPNTDGEIHIEPCLCSDIYEEYKFDMSIGNYECLSITQFLQMWQACFP
jgi:hypothetical protein